MTAEEAVRSAVEKGMGGIAFTDHLDLDAPRDNDRFVFNIEEQQKAIDEAVAKIKGESGANSASPTKFEFPEVFKGIEIGLQPCSLKHNAEYVKPFDFDVVIASIHFIDGLDPYFGNYYDGKDFRQAYGRVFELTYQTAKEYEDFDILGHFDYVARYAPYKERDVLYRDFSDSLDLILKYLAENGKALEINTKSYAVHHGHLQVLDAEILKRFKQLGGEMISLGSDSHTSDRVGDNFRYFSQMAQSCGFDNLVCFKKRKPIFYKP